MEYLISGGGMSIVAKEENAMQWVDLMLDMGHAPIVQRLSTPVQTN